ncbi:HU family DNA-binding protein [Methylomonas sp. AM2-LC]|uniref:HU family DNA-binding protein n=1 Tax=Methylomonas sp. AM2-LC TaxID=3153301 RepID=UPI0032659B22
MNKSELTAAIASHANLNKAEALRALDAISTAIQNALKNDESVVLVGFGTFEVKTREARKGRNPQTGAEITIPAGNVPAFKPGKGLKYAVNVVPT